jgi:hypothetical protein
MIKIFNVITFILYTELKWKFIEKRSNI